MEDPWLPICEKVKSFASGGLPMRAVKSYIWDVFNESCTTPPRPDYDVFRACRARRRVARPVCHFWYR
eukprot:SAG31_NODE_3759_length_3909_cov_2.636220_4_plen_68_part_00